MFELSAAHQDAVNRRRRIVVQYDAHGQLGAPFAEWLEFRFRYIDDPDSQIDAVWWDIGAGSWAVYPSQVLAPFEHPGLKLWREQGIDWVAGVVAETRRRNLEVFWNHRVSEVDIAPTEDLDPGTRLMMDQLNPVKAAHPDWVIKTWWWQGLWDYSVPAVRDYQLSILREVAQSYELDGMQLDFARHMPCLPLGRQWELREHATEFVRAVRTMLLEVEQSTGRPQLVAARIPETPGGCREDGLDIEAWARDGLVDILTLGSRSMQVDIAGMRQLTAGSNVKLQPCFDDHHATDGYRFQPIEVLRGVFGNWWQQGADSVLTFNWPNASPAVCHETLVTRWGRQSYNEPVATASHEQAYRECGDPATLARKDKVFAVERRGGYPWSEGYFNHNRDAPLPQALANDGRPASLALHSGDPVRSDADHVSQVSVRVVLFGAREGDGFAARLNGVPLRLRHRDDAWHDPQIFSPAPQPASGGSGCYQVNPEQKLVCLEFAVAPGLCRLGENRVEVSIVERTPYVCTDIMLEKLELHVGYRDNTAPDEGRHGS